MTARKVAVVGGGVSGLTAAYLLRRRHDVTLFEADDRLGGHAHTHDVPGARVDSGFIVHNDRTYPSLQRLFAELGVATQASEMSMSVRCDECRLEYAGAKKVAGLIPQARTLTHGRYLRLLGQVPRFHRHARRLLDGDLPDDVTLRQFLQTGKYSQYFVDHFLVPLVSCVWSAGADLSLEYPARYLFTFLDHHGMLSLGGSPQWRTVVGGSRSYVDLLAKELPVVRVGAPVRSVTRGDRVSVRTDDDGVEQFDHVVLATHADQALRLLGDPTTEERHTLGAFGYSENETWLHSDTSVLPRAPRAGASWNYLKSTCASDSAPVLVSYDMNRLQRLDVPERYVVTLNGAAKVDESTVIAKMRYQHPVYTPEVIAAQKKLAVMSGGSTVFAGAHLGWGFHEDGCLSGVKAAQQLGVAW